MTIKAEQLAATICKLGKGKVSNLKLQKIAYIIQMAYVGASNGEGTLIDGDFRAWRYGPVNPELYHKFKKYGADPIPLEDFDNIDMRDVEADDMEFIQKTCGTLLKLSAAQLVVITHKDGSGWDRTGSGESISVDDMRHEYEEVHNLKHS